MGASTGNLLVDNPVALEAIFRECPVLIATHCEDGNVIAANQQRLLAEQLDLVSTGTTLVRREFPTAIGPVDILARDASGATIAIELKRRGDIDGVEQLTRYLELMNRDPLLAPVSGVFAAQVIKPQARTLAEDRGIRCVTLDYDALRGVDDADSRLF